MNMSGAVSAGLRAQEHHPSWTFWMFLNVFSLASDQRYLLSLAPGQRCCVLHVFEVFLKVWFLQW